MNDLDLAAVRAFVVVADNRHFGEAAAQLGITQQAVSKRIAKLESDVGTLLLSRRQAGTKLSKEGAAFLPYARNLLAVADRTAAVLRSRQRPFRVDVQDTRLASADVVRKFYGTVRDLDLEVVTSLGLRASRQTLKTGAVDAAFARVLGSLDQDGIACVPAYLEPLQVLVGADHRLADQSSLRMSDLSGSTAWMPGNVAGSEWADFYDQLATEFSIRIDTSGPDFGFETFVRRFVESPDLVGFIGELTQIPPQPGVVRIPVESPRPCYLWSLLSHRRKPHAALPRLVGYVRRHYQAPSPKDVWLPAADWEIACGACP